MMWTHRFWYVTSFVVLAAGQLLSCSSSSNNPAACTPGRSIQCTGANGCVGAQVCSGDGFSYGECSCSGGPVSNNTVGGSKATGSSTGGQIFGAGGHLSTAATYVYLTTGGSQNTTAGGSTSGPPTTAAGGSTSGPPTTAAGGSTTSSSVCTPASTVPTSYPAYVPARRMPGSCTAQAISDYYKNCFQAGECAAFTTGGPFETCGTCLAPSPLTAASLGPLLQVGKGSFYVTETNVAGCEELVGETSCAPKMQIEFLCEYAACADNCPLSDYDSFNALQACMGAAVGSRCSSQHTAAQCLQKAASVEACSGKTFEAQFAAVAKVFCS